MYASVSHACPVPTEIRREHWISCNWSYVVSHLRGARNESEFLCKDIMYSLLLSHLPSPECIYAVRLANWSCLYLPLNSILLPTGTACSEPYRRRKSHHVPLSFR